MTLQLVPLTHAHLVEWYGDQGRGPTVKGVAGFEDGELIGVGGLAFARGRAIMFCAVKPEAKRHKTALHRTALRLMEEARRRHRVIWAFCDGNEKTAPKWLHRLGFRPHEGNEWLCRV